MGVRSQRVIPARAGALLWHQMHWERQPRRVRRPLAWLWGGRCTRPELGFYSSFLKTPISWYRRHLTSSLYTCSSVYPRPLTQPGTRHFLKLPSSVFCLLDFWVPLPGGSLPLGGLFGGREAGTHFPCALKIEASVLVFSKFVPYALKILSGLMPTTYFFVNY